MPSLRSIALAVGGIAVQALAAVFTLSLTVLAAALLTGSLVARALTQRTRQVPVYARATRRSQENMRVWNDGRGTIIDL